MRLPFHPEPEPVERWGDAPPREVLTLAHPHAVIAKQGFMAQVQVMPDGRFRYGPMSVPAGYLVDDRHQLVKVYPDMFRKPTPDEIEVAGR